MTHPLILAAIARDAVLERQREGERLARLLPRDLPAPSPSPRRALARVAARVSRASASIAVRLDDRVALTDVRRSPGV